MTENEFKRLSLKQKYNFVKDNGHYIANRTYRGMEAFLYKVDDFYVEVWRRLLLTEIVWIEVAPESTIQKYADSVNLDELLNS
jgi:hypothetical protein